MKKTKPVSITERSKRKVIQAQLDAANMEVIALRERMGRDFDREVLAGHEAFLETQHREDLLRRTALALEASEAHVAHYDQCAECQAAVLWCPKWYAICDDAEKQRKTLLVALKQAGFRSQNKVDQETSSTLRAVHEQC